MRKKPTVDTVESAHDQVVYEVAGVRPADLFDALAAAGVNVEAIAQVGSDIVFTAALADRLETGSALDVLGAVWSERSHLGRISVAGPDLAGSPGVAARAFAVLRDLRVESHFAMTSSSALSFFVPVGDAARVAEALREVFELAGAPDA